MNPKPGEVYLVDFGLGGKTRPVVIVSREDPNAARALAVCVPLTTSERGGAYEVKIGKPKFLKQSSTANVQGVLSVEHHELVSLLGRISPESLNEIKTALRWLLEL